MTAHTTHHWPYSPLVCDVVNAEFPNKGIIDLSSLAFSNSHRDMYKAAGGEKTFGGMVYPYSAWCVVSIAIVTVSY